MEPAGSTHPSVWARRWPRDAAARGGAGVAVGTVLALALVLVLATWHLTELPLPWFDEGLNMQGAMNLARAGEYGLSYAPGDLHPFDLQMSTGPTVIVPVALAFKLAGVGLAQGRAVMALFLLAAAIGLHRVASLLYGPAVAALALVIWCAAQAASPATLREVVGEPAALAFLFWGIVVLIVGRRRYPELSWAHIAAGALFGLATLSKVQFGLLVPTLVVVWFLTRGSPVGITGWQLLVIVTCLLAVAAAWQVFQFVALGGLAAFVDHVRGQAAVVSVSASGSPLARAFDAIRYLVLTPTAALSLAGLAYVWLSLARLGLSTRPAELLVLPVFAALWLLWFIAVSAGYDRYSTPILVIASMFLAVTFCDVVRAAAAAPETSVGVPKLAWLHPLPIGAALAIGAPIVSILALELATVAHPPAPDAQTMALDIIRQVDPGAVIETFDWQLDTLTDRQFHHPPPFVPLVPYTVPTTINYLVDGPWSKMYHLYTDELASGRYQRVADAGEYVLYRHS